jgi:O-antigen/teichoic acid export membrane protein
MSSKKIIIKGSFANVAGSVGGKIFSFASLALIGKFCGPESFGMYKLAFAILTLGAMIGMLGFRSAIPRFTARYLAGADFKKAKGAFGFSFFLLIPAALVVSAILYLGSDLIASRVFAKPGLSPLVRLGFLVIPPIVFLDITVGYLRGRKDFGLASFYSNTVVRFVYFLTVGFFILTGMISSYTAILGLGLAHLVAFAFSLLHVLRTRLPAGPMDLNQWRMVKYSWPLIFTTLMNQVEQRIDFYVLGYFLSGEVLGWYGACYFLISLLAFPLFPLKSVLLPVMSEIFAKDKREELKDVYASLTNWLTIVSIPLFVVTFNFSEDFITRIFGADFVFPELRTVILLLGIGNMATQLTGPKEIFLMAAGRTRILLILGTVFGTGTFLLSIVLVSRFGIVGAAASTAASLCMYTLWEFYYVKQIIAVKFLNSCFFKSILSGILGFMMLLGVETILPPRQSMVRVIGLIGIFLFCYGFMLYFLKPLSKEDTDFVKGIWLKRISRIWRPYRLNQTG